MSKAGQKIIAGLTEAIEWTQKEVAESRNLRGAIKDILKSFDENGEYADFRPGGHERLASAIRAARKLVESP